MSSRNNAQEGEKIYPNILFAKDGEIFEMDGYQTITIRGLYSIGKMTRVVYRYG